MDAAVYFVFMLRNSLYVARVNVHDPTSSACPLIRLLPRMEPHFNQTNVNLLLAHERVYRTASRVMSCYVKMWIN